MFTTPLLTDCSRIASSIVASSIVAPSPLPATEPQPQNACASFTQVVSHSVMQQVSSNEQTSAQHFPLLQ